jgi:hypothetical protein
VWNPIDVFNIKDVLDPTYEQPGHNAVRLDIPVGMDVNIMALYSPEDSWDQSAKLLQFKWRISRFDIAITGIEKEWRFHDYTQFDINIQNFTEIPEKRQLVGLSTSGELLGLGIWGEYGYNWMEQTDDFVEWVIGSNYTFDFQTYVMIEYYCNTLGKKDYQDYSLNDWMRLMASEQKAISREQLYILIQHPIADLIDFGLSSIYSISDGSVALVPTLTWSLFENVDVFAYLNYNIGKEGTAYSRLSGNGGLVRARVYF